MAPGGFDQLERRLHVILPTAVRKPSGFGSFDEPIEPAAILDPASSVVWAGMMLPDAIPICGDGCGDVILARFAADGSLREFVRWHHETCSWHPSDDVPGFAAPVAALDRQVAEALTSGLARYCREHGGEGLAQAVGVPWTTMAAWLADTDGVDLAARQRIARETSLTAEELFAQGWDRAEAAAAVASQDRIDLAWPGAVLGRAAERRGDLENAAEWYRRSLGGMQTTQSFTETWNEPGCPFAASRLRALPAISSESDVHIRVCLKADLVAVRRHWLDAGDQRLRDGRAMEAFDCYLRAGWDWHFTNDMDVVLEHLLKAAEAAASLAWTALVGLHLEALR
jgi:hypothetical protein